MEKHRDGPSKDPHQPPPEDEIEAGCASHRNLIYGVWLFLTLMLASMAITIATSIMKSSPSPLVTPSTTLFSPSGLPGAPYFQLTTEGATPLDMSTLPLAPNFTSLAQTLFPAGTNVSCVTRNVLSGDVSMATQALTVTLNDVTETLVTVETTTPETQFVALRLMCVVSLGLNAMVHLAACVSPSLKGGWSNVLAARTLRILILATYTVTTLFGTLISISLMGPPSWHTLCLWGSLALGSANVLTSVFRSGHRYTTLKISSSPTGGDGSHDVMSPMAITTKRLFLLGVIGHVAVTGFIVVPLVSRMYNWGMVGVLTDWAPLYSVGAGSLAMAAVWLFVSSLLVVLGLTLLWIRYDFMVISDNVGQSAARGGDNPVFMCCMTLEEAQIMLMLMSDMAMCLPQLVFGVLVMFGTMVPSGMAC